MNGLFLYRLYLQGIKLVVKHLSHDNHMMHTLIKAHSPDRDPLQCSRVLSATSEHGISE